MGIITKDVSNFWTPQEIDLIIKAARLKDAKMALFFETLWWTGRREGEVLGTRKCLADKYLKEGKGSKVVFGLRPKDIDVEKNEILWQLEKQESQFVSLPASPFIITKLNAWVEEKRVGCEQRIFDLDDQQASRFLSKLLVDLPVRKKGDSLTCSLNTFRHSHGKFAEQTCGSAAAEDRLQYKRFISADKFGLTGRLYSERLFDELSKV